MVKTAGLIVASATILLCIQAAPTNVSYKRSSPFEKRGDSYVCSSDGNASLMLTHFSAVFFGDFNTNGGQDILGPLAVEGDFKASGYYVNANGNPDCSNPNDISGYGLVVGGSVHANQVRVKGAGDVPLGSNGLQETQNSCVINNNVGIYDFNQAKSNAISASKVFATMKPTLRLDSNGKLTFTGASNHDFHVVAFNSCNDGNCTPFPGQMSDPSAMLEGIGNWNGPQGMSWPSDGTLVFNIPVDSGSTFTLKGNNPTNGLDPCRTIFNFYPSDSSGAYDSGDITLERNTGSNFGGFSLAPEAHIIDGSTGAFAGSVVGAEYSWSGSGVEIHNYNAAGGNCDSFGGCFPIHNNKPPPPVSTTLSSTTVTTTTSSETTLTTKPDTTTSDSTTPDYPTTTTTSNNHHSTTQTESSSTVTEPTISTTSDHHCEITTTSSSSTETTATTSLNESATTTTTGKHHHSTTDTDCSTVTKPTTSTTGKHHHSTTKTDCSSTVTKPTTSTTGKHHHKTTTTGKHHHSTTKNDCTSTVTKPTTSTTGKHHHKTTTTGKHHHSTTKTDCISTVTKPTTTEGGSQTCLPGCATATITVVRYVTIRA